MNREATSNIAVGNREEELKILVELVWFDLGGNIARDIVRQTVSSLYEEYDEATVRNFLPIIIQRRAKALLLQESSGEYIFNK